MSRFLATVSNIFTWRDWITAQDTEGRRAIWFVFWFLCVPFILFLLIFSVSQKGSWQQGLWLWGYLLAIVLGASAVGMLGGFLFAVPRRLIENPSDDSTKNNEEQTYTANDNLIQISDWLTIIIVGIGLVELKTIPARLSNLVGYLTKGNENVLGINAVVSGSLVGFAALGFLLVYLWGQMYLPNIFQDALKRIKQALDTAQNALNPGLAEPSQEKLSFTPSRGKISDDPWKGVFGGLRVRDEVELTAIVEKSSIKDFYTILLEVKSINTLTPLTGKVQFFLHDSFPNDKPIVDAENGVAKLNLMSWGAFTVGAYVESKKAKLELDLAELDVPEQFRMR